MRIILADDHREVRSALGLLLSEKSHVCIVGEAATADGLIALVKSRSVELVILDWELPGSNMPDLLKRLFEMQPRLSIIALSSRPQFRQNAIESGVRAFVWKSDPPEALLAALAQCSADGRNKE